MASSQPTLIADELDLPKAPIDHLVNSINRFLHVEAASGIVLLVVTVAALIAANSPAHTAFEKFWKLPVGIHIGKFAFQQSLHFFVNDGLMVIFFFVVGLEVKREMVSGELQTFRRAALPVAAALGGMIVPATIYLLLQGRTAAARGWGIPMATDIAFVVGCMTLLGKRVPHGLRVVMLSLAIADDIGAILVIAIGYTHGFALVWAGIAAGLLMLMVIIQWLGVRNFGIFAIFAMLVWVAFHNSGIHATLAGVILGLLTPSKADINSTVYGRVLDRISARLGRGDWSVDPHRVERVVHFQHLTQQAVAPLDYLIAILHPWVSFVIMPIFALANAGIPIHITQMHADLALAVAAALIVGKPLGILLASTLAVGVRAAQLPPGVTWRQLAAGGILAGIGFTMALFIAELALPEPALAIAKVGVLLGSLLSALIGMSMLWLLPTPRPPVLVTSLTPSPPQPSDQV